MTVPSLHNLFIPVHAYNLFIITRQLSFFPFYLLCISSSTNFSHSPLLSFPPEVSPSLKPYPFSFYLIPRARARVARFKSSVIYRFHIFTELLTSYLFSLGAVQPIVGVRLRLHLPSPPPFCNFLPAQTVKTLKN